MVQEFQNTNWLYFTKILENSLQITIFKLYVFGFLQETIFYLKSSLNNNVQYSKSSFPKSLKTLYNIVKMLMLKQVNDIIIIIINYYQYLKRRLYTVVEFFCTADNRVGTKVLFLRILICCPSKILKEGEILPLTLQNNNREVRLKAISI